MKDERQKKTERKKTLIDVIRSVLERCGASEAVTSEAGTSEGVTSEAGTSEGVTFEAVTFDEEMSFLLGAYNFKDQLYVYEDALRVYQRAQNALSPVREVYEGK